MIYPGYKAMLRTRSVLPSRAAYNLFWVGRYVERAEATLRLVRAMTNRAAEADEATAPVLAALASLLEAWSAIPDQTGCALCHASPANPAPGK